MLINVANCQEPSENNTVTNWLEQSRAVSILNHLFSKDPLDLQRQLLQVDFGSNNITENMTLI